MSIKPLPPTIGGPFPYRPRGRPVRGVPPCGKRTTVTAELTEHELGILDAMRAALKHANRSETIRYALNVLHTLLRRRGQI